MAENCKKKSGWKWLETTGVAENGWTWLKMAGNGLTWLKIAENGWKWLKWLKKVENG